MPLFKSFRRLFLHILFGIVCILLFHPTVSYSTNSDSQHLVPLHIGKGANLIKLARKYCRNRHDWKTIAELNELSPPYLIIEKQVLQVPLNLLKATNFSAKVISLNGEVYKRKGDRTIGEINKNDSLLPGETIVTGAGSYAHLAFPDHRYTRIAPHSELTINYLVRLADNKLKVELLLEKGRITHKIKRKLKQNETFKTRTPVSVTGVRGTEFRLKMADAKTNITETLHGTVNLQAGGLALNLDKGLGSKVIKDNPPTPPVKLPSPPASLQLEPVYKQLPVSILAPEHTKANSIRLRITRDKQGEKTLLEQQKEPGKKFMLAALEDGTYYCFLTAIDNQGFESLASGPYPLKIRTIPGAPLISEPRNKTRTFEPSIPIVWLKSEHAKGYKIELASDSDFSTVVDSKELSQTDYKTPQLEPGRYYFRVQAIAPDGFRSLYSSPLVFEIAKPSKLAPITGSPEDGLTLQWSAAEDGITFELQVGFRGDFGNPLISEKGLKQSSYTIKSYLEPGNYHIRVRSVLPDGQKSPWSSPQTFTIPQEPFSFAYGLTIFTLLLLAFL